MLGLFTKKANTLLGIDISSTSVKLLDPQTLVCASFLEKKLYLVRFDRAAGHHRILDEIATTHRGIPVETDLADVDASGERIALSNFHHGSLGLYRRAGGRLAFVADLDFGLPAKVHGVRFLDRDRIAVTVGSAPTGVRFFDLASGRPSIHVDLARKTQDVAFVSDREMIVLAVHGAPRRRRQQAYGSDVCRVRFDPATGGVRARRVKRFGRLVLQEDPSSKAEPEQIRSALLQSTHSVTSAA